MDRKVSENASNGQGGVTITLTSQVTATPTSTPSVDALKQLRSYRYTIKLNADGVAAETGGKLTLDLTGSAIPPDRSHVVATVALGTLSLAEESISIGNKTWIKQGNAWTEGTANFAAKELSPVELFANMRVSHLQSLQGQRERVNNIPATRYTLDRSSLEGLAALSNILGGTATSLPSSLPDSLTVDIWVAEDGNYPVKMTLKASTTQARQRLTLDFAYTLKDINDSSIRIEPPR